MSLRDHPPQIGPIARKYRIDEILEELDEADAEALRSWLADLRFSPERIARELSVEGYKVAANSIATYRFHKLQIGERSR